MNTAYNRRYQDTVQKIEDTIVDLLHEKAVREIAVTDICELAQIDRSTFYAHYDDLTALSKSFSEKTEKLLQSQPRTDENYA